MIKSKKGQLIQLIYIFFIATLLIFNIVIIYSLMRNIDVTIDRDLTNLKFNAIAARAIYSPDCLAYEESYTTDSGLRYRVYPGLIDINKKNNVPRCIRGAEYGFRLAKVDTTSFKETYINNYKACSGDWSRKGKFLVRIKDGDSIIPGIAEVCIK